MIFSESKTSGHAMFGNTRPSLLKLLVLGTIPVSNAIVDLKTPKALDVQSSHQRKTLIRKEQAASFAVVNSKGSTTHKSKGVQFVPHASSWTSERCIDFPRSYDSDAVDPYSTLSALCG